MERYLTSGALLEQFPFLEDVDFQNLLNTVGVQLASAIGQFGVTVLPVLGGVADTILSILIVIFLSIYLLADPQMHQEGLIRLFPISYRYRVREIFVRLDYTLRGWLRATIISMAFVGLATWLGLALLGIEQAVALGFWSRSGWDLYRTSDRLSHLSPRLQWEFFKRRKASDGLS